MKFCKLLLLSAVPQYISSQSVNSGTPELNLVTTDHFGKGISLTQQNEQISQNIILNQILKDHQNSQDDSNILLRPLTTNQQLQQDKCYTFTNQFKDAYDKIELSQKHSTQIQKMQNQVPLSQQSLTHLLLSGIEFCFSTQSVSLEMPYDLKIAQCLVAMHQYMGEKIHQISHDKNEDQETASKYDKEFCKELPNSLVQLSDYLYQENDVPQMMNSKELNDLKSFSWMPDYHEEINLNDQQNEINIDIEELEQINDKVSILEQTISISLKAWIRQLVFDVKNQCLKHTSDINVSFFVENCPAILKKQSTLSIASQSDINYICAQVKNNFQENQDKCLTLSKEIIELYLRTLMKPIFEHVMNFATSDSFFKVINDFNQTNWDLMKLEMSANQKENYAEQSLSQSDGRIDLDDKKSMVKSLISNQIHNHMNSDMDSEPEPRENLSQQSEKLIEQQQVYIELLEKQKKAMNEIIKTKHEQNNYYQDKFESGNSKARKGGPSRARRNEIKNMMQKKK